MKDSKGVEITEGCYLEPHSMVGGVVYKSNNGFYMNGEPVEYWVSQWGATINSKGMDMKTLDNQKLTKTETIEILIFMFLCGVVFQLGITAITYAGTFLTYLWSLL